jgi:hypothetical protein
MNDEKNKNHDDTTKFPTSIYKSSGSSIASSNSFSPPTLPRIEEGGVPQNSPWAIAFLLGGARYN